MGSKLFVGGLSWGTTDDTLRAAFEAFGPVREARVILDRDTGRSRGFGFVTFAQEADAATAIEQMNGAMLDGRSIRVNEAEERRGGGRGRRNDRGPGPVVQTRGRPPRRDGGGGGGGGGRSGSGGYRSRDGGSGPRRNDRGGGPPRRGGSGGYRSRGGSGRGRGPAPLTSTPATPGDGDWSEDRNSRRDRRKKRTKPREDEAMRMRQPAPKRDRRRSGKTWRDYNMGEEDDFDEEDDDFEFE
jgi:RNA recognition motif-containing protein